MPPSHITAGPLRSWVNVPHHLASATPITPRLASLVSGPPPSSSSTPFIRPGPQSRVQLPSSLKKGLRATKKSVSFLRSPSPPHNSTSTSTRPRFVRPGESSPRKGSHLLEGTTTFIPKSLDLTNVSPTRQSAFFAALKAARDLIDNPPSAPSHSPIAVQSPSPPLQPPSPIVQSPSPEVVQSPSPSHVRHRSPSPPCQSDFFAALKAVQDLIDNPPPPLSASPTVVRRSSSPVIVLGRSPAPKVASPIAGSSVVVRRPSSPVVVQSAAPKVVSPVTASPVVAAPACTFKRPTRKVFIPAPRPVVPSREVCTPPPKSLPVTASFGAAWVASRLAPKSEFVSADEDRRDRIRVLKWAADLPSPTVDTRPTPTALHEIPISPLSSSFFRSSVGAPSPSPTPSPRPLSFPSSKSGFACSSDSSLISPSTPERPSGFLDWWFDCLSPIAIEQAPLAPRFLENPSPVASSLFRSSLGAPEDPPIHTLVTPRTPSPFPTSPCSHTPSPSVQKRRPQPRAAGPDFSPPQSPRYFSMFASPSCQPPYIHPSPASSRSPRASSHPWKSVAGMVGIAAGAFTLGCLAARYLF